MGYGSGVRDAGIRRVDFDGSGESQYAFIDNWETRLSQTTSKLIEAGRTYKATILVGFDGVSKAGQFQLWAGAPDPVNPDIFPSTATLLAGLSVATSDWNRYVPDTVVSIGEWHPLELIFTAPSTGGALGQPLTVSFLTSWGSRGPTYWDNASLQVVPVPEPSAAILFSSALLFVLGGSTVRRRATS